MSQMGGDVTPKRVELAHDLIPIATVVGFCSIREIPVLRPRQKPRRQQLQRSGYSLYCASAHRSAKWITRLAFI